MKGNDGRPPGSSFRRRRQWDAGFPGLRPWGSAPMSGRSSWGIGFCSILMIGRRSSCTGRSTCCSGSVMCTLSFAVTVRAGTAAVELDPGVDLPRPGPCMVRVGGEGLVGSVPEVGRRRTAGGRARRRGIPGGRKKWGSRNPPGHRRKAAGRRAAPNRTTPAGRRAAPNRTTPAGRKAAPNRTTPAGRKAAPSRRRLGRKGGRCWSAERGRGPRAQRVEGPSGLCRRGT